MYLPHIWGGSGKTPATFTVNSTHDAADRDTTDDVCATIEGVCTFRAALQQANASTGQNTITFNLVVPDTIRPQSPLPVITDPIVIDGMTQPGFRGTPIVELNGAQAGETEGLKATAGRSILRGLVINGFQGYGVYLEGEGGNVIEGSYVGTDVSGNRAVPNRGGLRIVNSPDNVIGGTTPGAGNLLSGNEGPGIAIWYAASSHNRIQGNLIGTNAAGTAAVPNAGHSIYLSMPGIWTGAPGTIIGGRTSAARNVISGNEGSGIKVDGTIAMGTVIEGNFIGTDVTGQVALPNGGAGVHVLDALGTRVGGIEPGAGNLISGNNSTGIVLVGYDKTPGSVVQGNLVGTDVTGLHGLGNGYGGISITSARENTIGGTTPQARNVISGNQGFGVLVEGSTAQKNVIQGNLIGVAVAGDQPIGNDGDGVRIGGQAGETLVGGTERGAGNVIAFNSANGVTIEANRSNAVRRNQIHDNSRLGLETRDNYALATPILTSATLGGGWTTVSGIVQQNFTTTSTSFTVELFDNAACDSSGKGEGQTYLGQTVVQPSSASTAFLMSVPIPSTRFVTATATDDHGNTSMFSNCVPVETP